ncbi:MAG: glycoside hydrolase family 9 protein [Fibrobacteria bacterium]
MVFTGATAFAQLDYPGALKAAITFYDANRCGPDAGTDNKFAWRGACHKDDKIPGGYHDAGDHVKFGMPQAWSATTLAWAYYEYPTAFAPVKADFFRMLKYFTDYFLASHPSADVFWYNIGDGNADHGYWGAPEAQTGARPALSAPPGTDVLAETAAALALMSIIYKAEDAAYATKCLTAAKELYALAMKSTGPEAAVRGSDGAGGNFYKSSSHYDDLCWGGIWLYVATGTTTYLDPIEAWTKIPNDPGDNHYQKKWAPAWDDVILFVLLKMAEITGKQEYNDAIVWNLEWVRDAAPKSPGGMPVIDAWGVLRYASSEAGLGYTAYKLLGYSGFNTLGAKIMDYTVGSNPENRSYLTGWGRNPPIHPHHRANEPVKGGATKGIIGGLVGGPTDDSYKDEVENYQETEVAIDYNAAFIFGMAGQIWAKGGGKPKNRAPSVQIVSPSNGISIPSGEMVNIVVKATDADGKVSKIELYKGTELLTSGATSPLSFNYQSTGTAEVTFSAKATDDSGNVSNPTSSTVSFAAACTIGGNMERKGWKATASASSSNAGEGATSALDGVLTTRWTSGAGQAPGMWFQLDMGYPRSFDQVTLDASSSGSDFPQGYKVYASNDPAVPGTALAEGAGEAVTTIKLSATQKAQFIRVECTKSTGSFFSINEINVRCAATSGIRLPKFGSNAGFSMWMDSESGHVQYQMPKQGVITIEEFSPSGVKEKVLFNGVQEAGVHRLALPADSRGSKLTFLKVSYDGKSHLQKMVYLK